MNTDPESTLFDFAAANRPPTNTEEDIVNELRLALGSTGVPRRLRHMPQPVPEKPGRHLGSIAAALTLILAIAFGGFITTQQRGNSPRTDIPPVVLGLAGQTPGSSTPMAHTICTFSGDIPLVSGVNVSPLEEPTVIVTLEGDLKLVCDDNETLLAQGVMMATPSQTPYMLQAITAEASLLINIATGEQLRIPHDLGQSQQSIGLTMIGNWTLLSSSQNPQEASVYDLRTLEEYPLETENGPVLLEAISSVNVSSDNGVFALAFSGLTKSTNQMVEGIITVDISGKVQHLDLDLAGEPRQLAVSPDGKTVAISTQSGSPLSGTITVSIFDMADGTLLSRWETEEIGSVNDLTWLNDGSALVFTDRESLWQLEAPYSERTELFSGDQVSGLVLTRDSDVIAISHANPTDSGPWLPLTTIINLDTGEEITLEGHDLWAGSPLASERTTLVLGESMVGMKALEPGTVSHVTTGDSLEEHGDFTITRTAYDAVTGERIGEIDYTEADTNGFLYSSWGSGRDITVLAYSPDSMWKLVDADGNAILDRIVPPPGLGPDIAAVTLQISPDGHLTLRVYNQPANGQFGANSVWILPPGNADWILIDLVSPADSRGISPSISIIPGRD